MLYMNIDMEDAGWRQSSVPETSGFPSHPPFLLDFYRELTQQFCVFQMKRCSALRFQRLHCKQTTSPALSLSLIHTYIDTWPCPSEPLRFAMIPKFACQSKV